MGFISGGTFTSDPSEYLAVGHVVKVEPESYVVMPKKDLHPGSYKVIAGEEVAKENLASDGCEVSPGSGADTYVVSEHKAAADKKDVKAATCTETGYTGDEVCSVCGAVTVKGEAVPAAGHKTDSKKWGYDMAAHWALCDVCNVKAGEAEDHKFAVGKCTVCGAVDPTYVTASVEDEGNVGTAEEAATKEVAAAAASSLVEAVITGSSKPVDDGVVSQETYNKVQQAVNLGQTIEVVVDATPLPADAVEAADKDKVMAVVTEDGEVAQYLDLSVVLMSKGEPLGTIDKLDEPVTFTVAIPKDLVKDGRTFYVVRVHDGKAERLATTVKDGLATFETDLFSTYALAYEDAAPQPAAGQQPATDQPADAKKPAAMALAQTGDPVPAAALAVFAVALAAAVVCGVAALRRRSAR
ncbi:hypothetical protein [Adlercreutzia sp. ZJ242]|uniref:hypothetical protein n=1 Tax=Adlercreutzia sp. ZJ242 TaxID=2709409 RepID=UPI0013EACCF0|nr:hypothetical protein [Adlercreutzia sp. ZJ242]